MSLASCIWPFLIHIEHRIGLLFGIFLYLTCIKLSSKIKVICVLFFVGMLIYTSSIKFHYDSLPRSGTFHGQITVIEPQFSSKQATVLVRDEKGLLWRLHVSKYKKALLRYGDSFKIRAVIRPGQLATNPGQFNEARWFYFKGISGALIPTQIRFLSHQSGWDLNRLQFTIKFKILSYHQRMLPPPFSDLFTGLIFGDHGTRLPMALKALFRKAGLTHLLVVSGSQVSLIVGVVFLILRYLRISRIGIMGSVLGINILFYGITGGGASVLRAMLMSLIIVGFKLYHYRSSPAYVMVAVAMFMMILNPLIIFDLGAILSFLATLSLVYGVPWLSDRFPQHWPRFIRFLLSMTLAPFVFTIPFLWGIFYKVSVISLVTNLVLVPLIECVVILGFFTTVIGVMIPNLTEWMMSGLFVVLRVMVRFVEFMSQLSWAEISLGATSFIIIGLIYVMLWVVIAPLSGLKKKTFLSYCSLILCGLWVWGSCRPSPLMITFLDVGQGDATLIEYPNGKVVLVDTGAGRYPDAGRQVIAPYLAYRGIDRIDAIVITHYDFDHYGGLKSLSEAVDIGHIIDNGNAPYRNRLLPWLSDVTQFTSISQFDRLHIDSDVSVKCLSPASGIPLDNKNNRSVTLLVRYGDIDILLPGDLESLGESFLMGAFDPIDIDILKLGHHGSKTSTTGSFLNWCRPEIGIISCGRQNRYGHPHQSVISRSKHHNIQLYRTDKHGAIILKTDGKFLSITSYRDRYKIFD